MVVYIFSQVFAVKVFHDDIRGIVRLKIIKHVNNTVLVGKGGYVFSLEHKTLNAL